MVYYTILIFAYLFNCGHVVTAIFKQELWREQTRTMACANNCKRQFARGAVAYAYEKPLVLRTNTLNKD